MTKNTFMAGRTCHSLNRRAVAFRAFFLAALLAPFVVGDALANDNPFGLPAPDDKARPGAVMLHGGGSGLSDDVRREFVRLAGGRDARIVLVPSDQSQRGRDEDGNPLAIEESAEAYERRLALDSNYGRCAALAREKQIADFRFLYRDDDIDREGTKFHAQLERATGVWLPANDQAWLAKHFAAEYPKQTSRFQLALRNVVARGGVVGGLGGGMSCLAETMIASNAPADSGPIRAKLGFGLALFDGAVVDQHFASWTGRLERLSDLLRNGPQIDRRAGVPGVGRRTIGIGVERQTAVILQGNTLRAIGDGRAHVFLKGNGDRTITWRTMAPGDDPLVIQPSTAQQATKKAVTERPTAKPFDPFGFPPPLDGVKTGCVVLHGGGQTSEMPDLVPKLAGKVKPRLVHCPAARESCRPAAGVDRAKFNAYLDEEFSVWRELQRNGRIEGLTFVTTNDRADAHRAEFVAPLQEASALWFCGGDQLPLSELLVDPLRPTRFQHEAWNIVRRGGVVGGSSAGLAIMPSIVINGGTPENGKPAEAELAHGLGMLKHVLAEQHFDARGGRIERLTGLLRDHRRLANFSPTSRPKKMIGLAVEEDTALVVERDRLLVVGKRLAHVFLQSTEPRELTWHALKPGDAAVIRPGPRGNLLELEDWQFRAE